MEKDKKPTSKDLAEAMDAVRGGSGSPKDMWHPQYGWIMRNGEYTPEGIEFFKKQKAKK